MNRCYRFAIGLILGAISLPSACVSASFQQYTKSIAAGCPDSEVQDAFLVTLKAPIAEKYVILAAETHAPGIERAWITSRLQARPSLDTNRVLEAFRCRRSLPSE